MMEWFNIIRSRLRALFRRESVLRDIEEELRIHVEMETEANIKRGMPPDEARAVALKSVGNLCRNTERGYDIRVGGWLETLWQDLRYGARSLRKHALLSIVVIVTLTIGIGISTGVFTLVNVALLRARVDKDPASYAAVYSAYTIDPVRPGRPGPTTLEDYLAFRDQARSLSVVAAWHTSRGMLGEEDAPEVRVLFVTCNFFSLYNPGRPLLGRLLQPADCEAASPVVVLSERLWRSRFEADPQIVGKVTQFNNQPMTIVGVTPTFAGQIEAANVWMPYTLQTTYVRRPGEFSLNVGARLQPGFSRGEVAAELALIGSQQDRLHPGRKTTHIVTDGSQLQNPRVPTSLVWMALSLILGGLTCVVLITCANVTTLLLSRAAARHQEFAVRLALGAPAWRLLRRLLVETLLLAAVAGVASIYFAYRIPGLFWAWMGQPLLDQPPDSILRPDWRVFAYLAAVSLLAGTMAGLAPALQSVKVNLAESLKGRQPFSGGARGGAWLRSLLVGTQVSLSLVLLICAALFVRNYQQMSTADPGYETRRVILMSTWLRTMDRTQRAWPGFYRMLAERLEALPGAQTVAFTNLQPQGNRPIAELQIPGQPVRQAKISEVSPAFFATLGIPIVSGRALQEGDLHCGTNNCPVVVSEELARQFWPNANPLGQTLRRKENPFGPTSQITEWGSFEVVGVARDISTDRIGIPDGPTIYAPWAQNAPPGPYFALLLFTGDGAALARSAIATARALSPELGVEAWTIQSRIDGNLDRFLRLEILIVFLGAIAVILAALGIYGVVSFDVSRRAKEMGIRLALGARKRDIYGAVFVGGGRPIVVGLLVGLALALAGAPALARVLSTTFVINTYDPLAFVAAATLLVAVAVGAMLGPSRRATHVDPLVALRHE
jgi:putative ABC transport system permease protein